MTRILRWPFLGKILESEAMMELEADGGELDYQRDGGVEMLQLFRGCG